MFVVYIYSLIKMLDDSISNRNLFLISLHWVLFVDRMKIKRKMTTTTKKIYSDHYLSN